METRTPKLKWPRGQKFVLSEKGVEAEAAYRGMIVASREQAGRASFDAARTEWAKQYQVQAEDGMFLAELSAGAINAAEIARSVESSGKTPKETNAALERLIEAGLMSWTPA